MKGVDCPSCGSERVVPIVYGLPGPELLASAERGEVELGGCVVFDASPDLACKACGKRFRRNSRTGADRRRK